MPGVGYSLINLAKSTKEQQRQNKKKNKNKNNRGKTITTRTKTTATEMVPEYLMGITNAAAGFSAMKILFEATREWKSMKPSSLQVR